MSTIYGPRQPRAEDIRAWIDQTERMMKNRSQEDSLRQQRDVTRRDLLAKFYAEDWHGVADAAMDLREIDAELRVHKSTGASHD